MRHLCLAALAALLLVCPPVWGQSSTGVTNRAITLTATSPSSATTTAQTAVTDLGRFNACSFYAKVVGATGGTLDIYLQTSLDSGTTWTDVVHLTQLTAGASAVAWTWTLYRARGDAAAITASNTASGTPSLTANTIVNLLGSQLRVVFVAGASTSAGAAQTILGYCSV